MLALPRLQGSAPYFQATRPSTLESRTRQVTGLLKAPGGQTGSPRCTKAGGPMTRGEHQGLQHRKGPGQISL